MWSNFFCKLSFVTATSFDRSTDNKNSVNIYIFKEVTPLCQPCYLHCTLDLELKLHTPLGSEREFFCLKKKRKETGKEIAQVRAMRIAFDTDV